jgi:hypothetical protein
LQDAAAVTDAQYYRVEAQRCRELAAGKPDAPSAARWRQLAAEYEGLADLLHNAPRQPGHTSNRCSSGGTSGATERSETGGGSAARELMLRTPA